MPNNASSRLARMATVGDFWSCLALFCFAFIGKRYIIDRVPSRAVSSARFDACVLRKKSAEITIDLRRLPSLARSLGIWVPRIAGGYCEQSSSLLPKAFLMKSMISPRYMTLFGCLFPGLFLAQFSLGQDHVRFEKRQLTDRYYCDGINTGDFNGDGNTDIVAGPFWYAGPSFNVRHAFYAPNPLIPEESPSNSMFSFVHDFNRDGREDILVLGRVHKHQAFWYENPGPSSGHWKTHFVFERVRGESPMLVDIDGNQHPQLTTHWEGRWGTIQPDLQRPTEPWTFQPIGADEDWKQFYHGQGVGDINGDDRLDLVINDGWYEQPEDRSSGDWKFHRSKFSMGRGGAQMYVYDIDGDADNDVITSLDSHGWGLAWFEQYRNINDQVRFREHLIMGDRSRESELGAAFTQPHALAVADINGDGLTDLITGKRRWAHGPKGDIEPSAAPVVYWFELQRLPDHAEEGNAVRFIPHQIDDNSGVGVQIQAVDVNNDDRIDVLAASKLGTFVFINQPATQ